jgi:hypothetical protein
MKAKNRQIILLGEGHHQHTMYGDFEFTAVREELNFLEVKEDSLLRHETPQGEPAEHKTLHIDKGLWVQGKQVEYNPFTRDTTRVWD